MAQNIEYYGFDIIDNTKLATVDLTEGKLDSKIVISKCVSAAINAEAPDTEVLGFLQTAFLCTFPSLLQLVVVKFDVLFDKK